MKDRIQKVSTADGQMDTVMVYPDGDGPFPTIVMYQYAGGVTDILVDVARYVAANGYCCAVPDLYYRLGKIASDPDNSLEDAYRIRRIAVSSIAVPYRVMEDTKSLLEALDADPLVGKGPKGAIGFCQGGFYSALAAGIFPETFRATVSLFPTRLLEDRPDLPCKFFDKVQGEIYFGFPEFDEFAPESLVETYRQYLDKDCTAKWQIEVHTGTHHGYTFQNRDVYDEDAAQLSWRRAFDSFARQLR